MESGEIFRRLRIETRTEDTTLPSYLSLPRPPANLPDMHRDVSDAEIAAWFESADETEPDPIWDQKINEIAEEGLKFALHLITHPEENRRPSRN